jgi:DNA-binding MarR family transcriptional regulator
MGSIFSLQLPKPERDVLLALADHARDDGSGARPGVGLLSWKVDLSPRQVKRLLRKLEERGLIIAIAHRGGGRGRATEFQSVSTEASANLHTALAQTVTSGRYRFQK